MILRLRNSFPDIKRRVHSDRRPFVVGERYDEKSVA